MHLLALGSRYSRRSVVHPAPLRQSRGRELRIVAQTSLRVLTQHDVFLQGLVVNLLIILLQLLRAAH